MSLPLPVPAAPPPPPSAAPVRPRAALLDPGRLKDEVEEVLNAFLARKAAVSADGLPNLVGPLQDFLAAGGKRIRPVLAMVGWHAAGAAGSAATARNVAASLELFHAFALIHDDVMDGSATRRGRPTVHRIQASEFERLPCAGPAFTTAGSAAERFGRAAAVLIGDLALIWSDELLHAGRPTQKQLARVLPLLDTMRTELTQGQYLDLAHTGRPSGDLESALTVIRYKTAKYTVERPLHLGAALSGADPKLLESLSAYAIPLGEAFQLRDDLLGVFGDPQATGKPALDDLREGKATALVAVTLQRADRAQADRLRLLLGCGTLTQSQAQAARRIITATGARDTVDHMITQRHQKALSVLDGMPIPPAAADILRRLADEAVRRRA
ncbi:polyprenyl synthetase family protein [Streptomyces sp. NRRL S-237]|uniref:polyprenyl synthetase family protein n=1 Tax=Streptomyces sp. NRRL S-237 TaxID=1463895 RepID=UPI00099DCB42|nr:polyprenyl synthetase family protein [Streptomyces sp. NRRL S-237]